MRLARGRSWKSGRRQAHWWSTGGNIRRLVCYDFLFLSTFTSSAISSDALYFTWTR